MSESFNFETEYNKLPDKLLLALGVILIDIDNGKINEDNISKDNFDKTGISRYKHNFRTSSKINKQPKEIMLATIEPWIRLYLKKKITNDNDFSFFNDPFKNDISNIQFNKSQYPLSTQYLYKNKISFKTLFNELFNKLNLSDAERKKINAFVIRYKDMFKDNAVTGETYLKLWNDTIKAPSAYKRWVEKDVLIGQKPDKGTKNIYTFNKNKYTQTEIVYGPILNSLFEAIKKVNSSKSYTNISQQISNITEDNTTTDFLFKNVPNEINFVSGYTCSKDLYRNMIKKTISKVKGDMLESMIIHKSLEPKIINQYNWSLFFNNVVFHGNDKFYDIMKVRRTNKNFLAFDKLIALACKNLKENENLTSVINSLIDTEHNDFFKNSNPYKSEYRLNIPLLLSKLVKCFDMIQPDIPETEEKDKIRKLVERIFTVNYNEVNRYETAKELMDIKTENVFPGRIDDIVLIQSKAGPFSLVDDWLNDTKYNNRIDALQYGTNLDLSNIQTEAVAKDKSGELKRFKLTPFYNYGGRGVSIEPLDKWYGDTYFDFGEDKKQLQKKLIQLSPKIKNYF